MAAPSGALRSAGAQGAGGRCAGPEGRRRTVLLLKSKSTESDGIKSLPPSLCRLIPSLEVAAEDISSCILPAVFCA